MDIVFLSKLTTTRNSQAKPSSTRVYDLAASVCYEANGLRVRAYQISNLLWCYATDGHYTILGWGYCLHPDTSPRADSLEQCVLLGIDDASVKLKKLLTETGMSESMRASISRQLSNLQEDRKVWHQRWSDNLPF